MIRLGSLIEVSDIYCIPQIAIRYSQDGCNPNEAFREQMLLDHGFKAMSKPSCIT